MTDATDNRAAKGLLPEWMDPGPTVYSTLMMEAMREVLADGDEWIVERVPPALRSEFLRDIQQRMSRVYVRGVQSGYEQAGRAFDTREVKDA